MEIKNIVLGIAIIILTSFVTIYGMSVFYPNVDYDEFCGRNLFNQKTEADCVAAGGQWSDEITNPKSDDFDEPPMPITDEEGYRCQAPSGCYDDYDKARESRAKKIFYFSIPLAIAIIFLGGFLFHLEAVGAGLMGGGAVTLIYGAGGYWRYGDELFRFIMSLLGLAAVIYISYWLNKKHGKKKFF